MAFGRGSLDESPVTLNVRKTFFEEDLLLPFGQEIGFAIVGLEAEPDDSRKIRMQVIAQPDSVSLDFVKVVDEEAVGLAVPASTLVIEGLMDIAGLARDPDETITPIAPIGGDFGHSVSTIGGQDHDDVVSPRPASATARGEGKHEVGFLVPVQVADLQQLRVKGRVLRTPRFRHDLLPVPSHSGKVARTVVSEGKPGSFVRSERMASQEVAKLLVPDVACPFQSLEIEPLHLLSLFEGAVSPIDFGEGRSVRDETN